MSDCVDNISSCADMLFARVDNSPACSFTTSSCAFGCFTCVDGNLTRADNSFACAYNNPARAFTTSACADSPCSCG
ncbi:hypothetical protein [Ureibacillus sp. FSL K6-2830]|uniref:hypothetical protein n=1 Tax=Ureibacillus sp. FSL K6-2830 TaxID=2954610 RepID=UPI0030FC491A